MNGMGTEDKLIPCKHMFSNGTEYELFVETQCLNGCTRYRKHSCRIINAIEKARWIGESAFPFDDLLEWERYDGKRCKRFTTEKTTRKPPELKPLDGQLRIE